MADYYRNIHLLFLKGKAGSELSHSPALKEKYKTMSWKKDFIPEKNWQKLPDWTFTAITSLLK